MTLAFMDLLGTKSKWNTGGRAAAEQVFKTFEALITKSLGAITPEEVVTGGIESDSCAFVFATVFAAAKFVKNDFVDYLWMLSSDSTVWEQSQLVMANRLRWSSQDSEEFLHAAATQVVFNECVAIIHSLVSRNKPKKELGITSR